MCSSAGAVDGVRKATDSLNTRWRSSLPSSSSSEKERASARDLEADAGPHEGGGELQDGDLGVTGADSHEEAKSPGLKSDSGERGLAEVTLTGAQLVDYLKVLEQDISGGPGAKRSVEVLSRRMYEAIAPVVARATAFTLQTPLFHVVPHASS